MRKSRSLREAATTPTKDGLPRKAYAYAPSSDTSTWKLPFLTASGNPDPDRLPGAVAALSEGGFRGQKADIPASAVASVKRKLRTAYRSWKGADAEIPDTIKETAFEIDGFEIREAVVLLDHAPISAQVIVAPNGDTLVVPNWTGQFDGMTVPTPFVPTTPTDPVSGAAEQAQEMHDWDSSMDVSDAASVLADLVRLKKNENGETDEQASLQTAIDNVLDFVRAEAAEIGQPIGADDICPTCAHDYGCECDSCSCSMHGDAVVEAAAFLADPATAPLTPGAVAAISEAAAQQQRDPLVDLALWEDPDDDEVRVALAANAPITEAGPAYIFGRKNPNYTPASKSIESDFNKDENKRRDAKVRKSPYYKAFLKANPGTSPREYRRLWLSAARSGAKSFAAFKKLSLSSHKLSEAAVTIDEAGRRNNSRDQQRVQKMHDLSHELGAEHIEGQTYAGMAEAAADTVEVRIEAKAVPVAIRFRESAGTADAIPVTLMEADPLFDDTSRTVWITPIKPGWGNTRDNNYYPASTLREATLAGQFNNKKMFRDHPSKSAERDLPERSVKDWFATTREAVWDEARQEPRVPVKVHDDAVWRQWRDAPEQVAYSVLGGGSARPGSVDGRSGRIIESIVKVGSIDWVTEAGAGGAIAFAESAVADEEFDMDLENLTAEQLREANPTLFATLTGQKDVETGDEKPTPTPPPTPSPTPTPTPVAEAAPAWFTAAMAPVVGRLDAIEQRDQASLSATRVIEAKAAAKPVVTDAIGKSTLPTHARTVVASKFAEAAMGEGQTFADEAALREAVAAEITAAEVLIAPLMRQNNIRGLGPVATTAGEAPVREAVVKDIETRWGKDQIPAKGQYVFTADQLAGGQIVAVAESSGRDEDATPEGASAGASTAPISEAGQGVQDRLASRLGVG